MTQARLMTRLIPMMVTTARERAAQCTSFESGTEVTGVQSPTGLRPTDG